VVPKDCSVRLCLCRLPPLKPPVSLCMESVCVSVCMCVCVSVFLPVPISTRPSPSSLTQSMQIVCFNELESEMGKVPFRPACQRSVADLVLLSDEDDPELLIVIPFTSHVILRSFIIKAHGDSAPSTVRLFINRDDLDLSDIGDATPEQEFNLAEDPNGDIQYSTRVHKFQGVSTLLMHFPASRRGDHTRIEYVELRGLGTQNRREVINVAYEAVANPQDHKTQSGESMRFGIH